jgi:hypothetical protein
MLEEIIACFLSLFSALTLDTPQLSREMNDNSSSSEQCIRYTWEDKIHREYVSFEEENYLPSETQYVQLGYKLRNKPTYIYPVITQKSEGDIYHNLSRTVFGIYRDGSYIFRFKNNRFMF